MSGKSYIHRGFSGPLDRERPELNVNDFSTSREGQAGDKSPENQPNRNTSLAQCSIALGHTDDGDDHNHINEVVATFTWVTRPECHRHKGRSQAGPKGH